MPGGRPIKNGVDYFPLDVVMDDKIELIESEHGIEGFGVIIKLLQKIYANNFFYIFDRKAVMVFSNRVNVDINLVYAVINSANEWGIFDKVLYNDYQALTSKGIQKRFFEIVKRRKNIEIIKQLLLIDIEVSAYTNLVYVNIKRQRKGKERKGTTILYTTNFLKFWELYPNKTGKGAAFKSYQKIKNPKPTLNEILQSIEIHNQADQWQNKEFIPNPSTWLNQRRWEDEVEDESTQAMADRLYPQGDDDA